MDCTKIYDILSSKEHNSHFLKKYVNFLKKCFVQNINYKGYVEVHHICPKAKTLFPEYANLTHHKWNCIKLTPRQHFIAHWMLWKCYGDSQYRCFWMMVHGVKTKKHDERYKCSNSKLFALLKEEHSRNMRGDKNYFHNHKFVGENNHFYGKTHTQETKELISKRGKGRKDSKETKIKKSLSHKGKKHSNASIEHLKNLKWYHDPVTKNQTKALECPVGFQLGRVVSEKAKLSYKATGMKKRGPNNKIKEASPVHKTIWYYNPLTNEEKRSKFPIEGFLKGRRPKNY